MGKGWGSVDVDTDWVVGEASGGVWGSVDVETECVAGCGLVEVALVAVAARDLSKKGNPAAGIGDEAGGLAPSIHTAVFGDSAG